MLRKTTILDFNRSILNEHPEVFKNFRWIKDLCYSDRDLLFKGMRATDLNEKNYINDLKVLYVIENNNIISYAAYNEKKGSIYLDRLETAKNLRSKGYGGKIIEKLKKLNKEITLVAASIRAIKFYENHGFHLVPDCKYDLAWQPKNKEA